MHHQVTCMHWTVSFEHVGLNPVLVEGFSLGVVQGSGYLAGFCSGGDGTEFCGSGSTAGSSVTSGALG